MPHEFSSSTCRNVDLQYAFLKNDTLSRTPSSAAGTDEVSGTLVVEGPGFEIPASAGADPLVLGGPAGAEELAAAGAWASTVGVDAAATVIRQQHCLDATRHKAVGQETLRCTFQSGSLGTFEESRTAGPTPLQTQMM